MHLLRIEHRSIDGTAEAVDLGQTPADIVALSFTDTDLSMLAAAWEAGQAALPTLRLANLAALRHPYSVDLYIEKVIARSRFVLVRLLGGKDYWGYGVDELATLTRTAGIPLAIVPGDHRPDARLDEASTLAPAVLRRIGAYFTAGGVENVGACLRFIVGLTVIPLPRPDRGIVRGISTSTVPRQVPRTSRGMTAEREPGPPSLSYPPQLSYAPPFGHFAPATKAGPTDAPTALIIFYRAWMLAADTAPIIAQSDALAGRGFRVAAIYVTSLKDASVIDPLRAWLATERPDIILNMTAFSARSDTVGSVLDEADAPVFQLVL
ncbi:MAG: cobaltochelatase subunit CobN, partial [Acetobacteraceae bacterium]